MEEYTIQKYIKNNKLDIENMINDYKDYIYIIVKNNSKGYLNNEDVEEVVSDVFLTIWHNKNRIDDDKPLKKYIAGITKKLILKKYREKKHTNLEMSLDDEIVSSELNNIEYVYENNLVEETINEELNNLTELEYNIFTKFYYFSKSIKEISKEMNISESLVKVKLHRIRKKLKKNLEKKGIVFKNIIIIFIVIPIKLL